MNFSAFFDSSSKPYKSTAALLLFIVLAAAPCVRAQEAQASPAPSPTPSEAEAARRGLARARALAAIGKLAAAAGELETLRAATREESLRDVARVLLVSIYVEMPDYPRAAALLDETFKGRRAGQADDAATHAYFALAGQTVNSVRQHLERYRLFGLDVGDDDLPAEANGDLEQLRRLLERVAEHAKAIGAERAGTISPDATALFEDAATVRMRIARQGEDRVKWQGEVSAARQQLFASETRLAALRNNPGGQNAAGRPAGAAPSPAPAGTTSAAPAPTPAAPGDRADGAQNVRASAPAASPTPAPSNTAPAGGQTPQAAPALVAVGSLNQLARQRVTPSYPQIARSARVTGVVTVYLVVNEKGEVASIERAEGPLQLQQAASEAARRWRFNQTVVNGQPVRVSGYLSFNFAL